MVADLLFGLANAPYVVSAWLLTYAFHSTVLIGGAWLLAIGLARISCRSQSVRLALPALREKLWKFALVGGLATASLQTVLGLDPWGARIDLRPAGVARTAEAGAAEDVASPASSFATLPVARALESLGVVVPQRRPHVDRAILRASEEASAEGRPLSATATPAAVLPVVSASFQPTWVQVVLALWIAGVLFGVARWICQWNRLLRDIDDRSPVLSGTVWEVYQLLRARARSRTGVRLSMAPALRAPITLGLRHYEICLPPRVATELQRDEIAVLLAHELAHAERRDPLWLAVCRLVEVVFFFQPLNRLCASWLSDEAEYLCDDWAVVQVGERVALASCLTEIAGWIVHGDEPRLASGMAAPGRRLSLRVGRLLDEDHDPARAPRTRWVAAALVPVALSVAVLVPRVSADSSTNEGHERPSIAAQIPDSTRDGGMSDAAGPGGAGDDAAALFLARTSALASAVSTPIVLDLETSDPSSHSDAGSTSSAPAPAGDAFAEEDIEDVLRSLSGELAGLREQLADRGGCTTIADRIDALDGRLSQLRLRAANVRARVDALGYADSWTATPFTSDSNSTHSFRSKD